MPLAAVRSYLDKDFSEWESTRRQSARANAPSCSGSSNGDETVTAQRAKELDARRLAAAAFDPPVHVRRVDRNGHRLAQGISYRSTPDPERTDGAEKPYRVHVRDCAVEYTATLDEANAVLARLLDSQSRHAKRQKRDAEQDARLGKEQAAAARKKAKAVSNQKRVDTWADKAREVAKSAPARAMDYVRSYAVRKTMRAVIAKELEAMPLRKDEASPLPLIMWDQAGERMCILNLDGTLRAMRDV